MLDLASLTAAQLKTAEKIPEPADRQQTAAGTMNSRSATDTSSQTSPRVANDTPSDTPSSATSHDQASLMPTFAVRIFEGKGRGLMAIQHIEKESSIVSERALIQCPRLASDVRYVERALAQQVNLLKDKDRDFFMNKLMNAFKDAETPLTGRVLTNALPCGRDGDYGAVFKYIALANHCCIPNAEYYWDEEVNQGVLYALTDIFPGEEITISYVDMMPTNERRKKLQDCFGFVCTCSLCTMSKKRRREEDKRIREITTLQNVIFNNPKQLREDVDAALAKFQRLTVLFDESEVDYGRDMARVWAAIADLFVSTCEQEEAIEKLMALTGLPKHEAADVVTEWFAEHEDELPHDNGEEEDALA